MGLKNFFMIIGEKNKSAFVKIKNAFTKFFEKALNMMKKVLALHVIPLSLVDRLLQVS